MGFPPLKLHAIRSLLAIINHFGAFNLCCWYWVVHLSSSWWPWKCVIISVSLFLEEIMKVVRYFYLSFSMQVLDCFFCYKCYQDYWKGYLVQTFNCLMVVWWNITILGVIFTLPLFTFYTCTPYMYFNVFYMLECKCYKWWKGMSKSCP